MFSKFFTKQTIGLFAVVFVLAFAASAPIVFEKTTSFVDDAVVSAFGDSADGGCCGGEGQAPDPGEDGNSYGGGQAPDPDPVCTDPAATNYAISLPCVYAAPVCTASHASVPTINLGQQTEIHFNSDQSHNTAGVDIRLHPGNIKYIGPGSFVVTPTQSTDYTVVVANNGGAVHCPVVSVTVNVPGCIDPGALNPTPGATVNDGSCLYPDPAPTCDYFTANGQSGTLQLPIGGGTVELGWGTTNATYAAITPDGTAVVGIGTKSGISVTDSQIFTLDISGPGGTDSCTVAVDVEKIGTPPVTCDDVAFSASDYKVDKDSVVNLSWVFTGNVESASLSHGSVDPLTVDNVDVTVSAETIYAMTIGNSVNSIECPLTVELNTPTPDPITCAANVVFTGNPLNHDVGGGNTDLTWTVTGADKISINNGVLAETTTLNGNDTILVTTDTIYTLTAQRGTEAPILCTLPVTVDDPVTDSISCAANVPVWKSEDYNISKGSSVKITWEATGLDTISIDNSVLSETSDFTGSEDVSPSSDTRYVLTGKKGSETITCELNIDVNSGGGGGSSNPRCDFDASQTSINAGEEITLSWDNRYTRDLTIFDGDEEDGKKIFETDDDDLVDEGSIKVRPTKNTTYTLLAERGSRDRTCDVDIKVKDNVVLSSIRDQGVVAGISLSAVPYTGFDAGPTLTFIFYALLAIWGLFVAYVLVIRKDSMAGASLAGAHPKNSVLNNDYSTSTSYGSTQTSEAAAYVGSVLAAEPTATPVAAATIPSNLPVGDAHVLGYQAAAVAAAPASGTIVEDDGDAGLRELENRAHEQSVLLSSDAMRELIALCPSTIGRMVYLDMVAAEAKVTYPAEDDWVVLNQERVKNICHKCNSALAKEATPTETTVVTPSPVVPVATNAGSLAEAMATGNITAAYQMIGHRPMIALADAASDLDALYRTRKGEQTLVSNMLTAESSRLTDEQITAAITALTSAIDGTYDDEAGAVKMAILKATKALA